VLKADSLSKDDRRSGICTHWIRPEPGLAARYGDVLAESATHFDEAHRYLRYALLRQVDDSAPWHFLARLLGQEARHAEAELALRAAACLDLDGNRANELYAWALKKRGAAEQGIAWQERRLERLRERASEGAAWAGFVELLVDFGQPGRAMEALEEARRRLPDDPTLVAAAARYLAGWGRLEAATEAVERARRVCGPAQYHAVAYEVAQAEGRYTDALEHAREWVAERPREVPALEALLWGTDHLESPAAGDALLAEWRSQRPADEVLERLELLRRDSENEESRFDVLRARVERNPFDGWAWRELGFLTWGRVRRLEAPQLPSGVAELREVVESCTATDPSDSATILLEAEVAALEGDLPRALDDLGRSLLRASSYTWSVSRLFELASTLPVVEREGAVVPVLDRAFESTPGDLRGVLHAAKLVAAHFGPSAALDAIDRWATTSRDDPYLAEARADVLVRYGEGPAVLSPLLPELVRLTEMFPLHGGLAFSLADVYERLDRSDDALATYERLLSWKPRWGNARAAMAHRLAAVGRQDEAISALRRATRDDPWWPGIWRQLADTLVEAGDGAAAEAALVSGLGHMPETMDLWEARVELVRGLGRGREALEVADELRVRFPNVASAHMVFARACLDAPFSVDDEVVDAAFGRAIELDARLWDAVWSFTCHLCAGGRSKAARDLVVRHRALVGPAPWVEGALAYVRWHSGAQIKAVEELRALLLEQPDYDYGVTLLFDWLTDLGDRGVTERILEGAELALFQEPERATRRLELLDEVGVAREALAPQWADLQARCPASRQVRADHASFLLDGDEREAARVLLEGANEEDAAWPPLVAQRLRLAVEVADWDGARAALEVLFVSHVSANHHWWARVVFEALRGAKGYGLTRALKAFRGLLRSQTPVNRIYFEAFLQALACAKETEPLQALVGLLETREACAANPGLLGQTLQACIEAGVPDFVRRWGRANSELCAEDTEAWMAVGWGFSCENHQQDTIDWLRDYRSRPDSEQWAINLVAASYYDTGRHAEALDVCRYGLENRPIDHGADFLVDNGLKCALTLGDEDGFLALHDDFGAIIETSPREKFRPRYDALGYFARLLRTSSFGEVRALHAESRALRVEIGWTDLWKTWVSRRLRWWQSIWFRLGLFGR